MKTRIYIHQITSLDFSEEVIMVLPNGRRELKVGDRFHIGSPLLVVTEVNRHRKEEYSATAVTVPERKGLTTPKRKR